MTTTVQWLLFTSTVLADNPLGDPVTRITPVVLPPDYDANSSRRYPVLYGLTGYTGRGAAMLNSRPWGQNLQDRLNRLYSEGMPHAIFVLPDCFTAFGGSQYVNSSAVGNYEDYLVREIVPWIDSQFRTIPHAGGRGVFGKSSGGYGAIMMGMRHPDVFSAVADHSGDAVFELGYKPDFPKTANAINAAGGLEKWWESFKAKTKKRHSDIEVMNIIAMAACYSPNPNAPLGLDLPFDPYTCEIIPEVWERWLAFDPYELVERYADALRSLRLLFIDCGNRDEFNLHFSARRLVRKLQALNIPHIYEEFDDGHMEIDYRYDVSLPKLLAVLDQG